MFNSRTVILTLVLILAGCETPISLRNDVFQSKPLWKSTALGAGVESLTLPTISKPEDTGLYNLVAQVLGPDHPALAKNVVSLDDTSSNDDSPLPDEIAKLPATKAIVGAMLAERQGSDVPDVNLSTKDFRDLSETFLRSSLNAYQNPTPQRLVKLVSLAAPTSQPADAVKRITWQAIATKYFTEYYKGDFVDRTGGKLSKPTIGLKIPNESITSALTVFLEATFDYVQVRNNGHIKNPIVYVVKDSKPQYQTKDNAVPTLVALLV